MVGSAAFVGWYNGHPDFADLDPPLDAAGAAVIGNGNVALDVARILAKTRAEFAGSDIVGHALDALEGSAIRTIHVLGRRGPHQIAMTPKELGELGHLEAAVPEVDPADFPPECEDAPARARACANRSPICATSPTLARGQAEARSIFDFFAMPVAVEGDGQVERLIVERTRPDRRSARGRHRRDLRDRLRPGRQLHRLSDPADRRACPTTTRPRPLRQ